MSEVRLIDANVADKILTELCITIQDTGNVSGISGTIVKSVRPCVVTGVRAAQVALNNIPTINTKPVRHGRWIEETEPDENGNVIAVCNQCYHTDEHCKNIKIPYCWNCGADMREDTKCDESD